VPVNGFTPAEATQATPISAIEVVRVGPGAPSILSTTLRATALAIVADGIPVRGGGGATGRRSGSAGGLARPGDRVGQGESNAGREQVQVRRGLVQLGAGGVDQEVVADLLARPRGSLLCRLADHVGPRIAFPALRVQLEGAGLVELDAVAGIDRRERDRDLTRGHQAHADPDVRRHPVVVRQRGHQDCLVFRAQHLRAKAAAVCPEMPTPSTRTRLMPSSAQVPGDELPVDEPVEHRCDVVRAAVPIVQVVRVLPHVDRLRASLLLRHQPRGLQALVDTLRV